MRLLKYCLLLLGFLIATPVCAGDISASSQQAKTKMTLVTERMGITPGEPIHAGILIEANEGWHTYWENPGDAGLATKMKWTLPTGFTASAINWPLPQKLTEGPLVTYSYVGSTFLPVTITPSPALTSDAPYTLRVKVDVLVCNDICVPESAQLEVALPMANSEAPLTPYAHVFDEHRAHQPKTLGAIGQFTIMGKQLVLSVPIKALAHSDIASANFFVREQNLVNYASPQTLKLTNESLILSLDHTDESPGSTVSGLLVITAQNGEQVSYNVEFSSAPVATVATPSATPVKTDIWLPAILLFALLGGLILNLMPCVLPILSLKALAIAQKSASKHEHVVVQGIAYTLGILASFAGLAVVLLSLRAAGHTVGWGYQMQSPVFVAFLIYLLFLVGLNLSGVFHFPVLLGGIGGNTTHKSSIRGSFFTGVLATAVATPCTAPFMAGAVGAALTLPAWQAFLVFETLGFGLACPFLLISLFPAMRRFLPKPGAWMDHFKQLLAFPMYASVIWLLWVLTLQAGAAGMVVASSAMLAITFVIYMKSWFEYGSSAYRIIAILLYALIVIFSLSMLHDLENIPSLPTEANNADIQTIAYSKEKLTELQQAGMPVLVDVTAAWCITCQVNIHSALMTKRTMAEFKRTGVTLMVADWTKPSDEITNYLRSFGFSGVPLAVFYPAHGIPVVLPQILTENTIINTLTQGDK